MTVGLRLDALIWWLAGDPQLTDLAQATMADSANEVFVSAASAWEVATKCRLGKLPGAGPLAVDFGREVRQHGLSPLPITLDHAQEAGGLPWANRDPFDRMLVAQARQERMALISVEAAFDVVGVQRIW